MQSVARRTKASPRLSIGVKDAGLPFTWEEYQAADFEPGFRYELIDGSLIVAAMPKPKHTGISMWVHGELFAYHLRHPKVFNVISSACEIVISGRPGVTAPQPDLALYRGFPRDRMDEEDFNWESVFPFIVIEIVSPDSADKDFFRNVTLYELEPTIREYWIIDPRRGLNKRALHVYRRRGDKWQKPIVLNMGDVHTTKLLPGFRLRLDPIR